MSKAFDKIKKFFNGNEKDNETEDFFNVSFCDHDPNHETTSLLVTKKKRTMVYPDERWFVCKNCMKTFHFIHGEDGKYVIK